MIKTVALSVSTPDRFERVLEIGASGVKINDRMIAVLEIKIVHPDIIASCVANPVGMLTDHPQTQIFQQRNNVRQFQLLVEVEHLKAHHILLSTNGLIETHCQLVLAGQLIDCIYVVNRRAGFEVLPVPGRKRMGVLLKQTRALLFAVGIAQRIPQSILPAASDINDLSLQTLQVVVEFYVGVKFEYDMAARQHRLREKSGKFQIVGLYRLSNQRLNTLSGLCIEIVTRHIHSAVHKLAVGVRSHKQPHQVAFLNIGDTDSGFK